jgi:hypothetical protein
MGFGQTKGNLNGSPSLTCHFSQCSLCEASLHKPGLHSVLFIERGDSLASLCCLTPKAFEVFNTEPFLALLPVSLDF